MDSVELQGKKRKRKHSSSKAIKEDSSVPAIVSEVKLIKKDKSEKAHKKSKKVHQSEDDSEEGIEEPTKQAIGNGVEESLEGAAHEVIEDDDTEEFNDEDIAGGEELDLSEDVLGVGALSLPSAGVEAEKFSELNLSEKTMKALEGMKFEKVVLPMRQGIKR